MSGKSNMAKPIRSELASNFVFSFQTPELVRGSVPQSHAVPHGSDFQVSEASQVVSGMKKQLEEDEKKLIDQKVLEALQPVQEKAYQEAYQLGLEDGRIRAFDERKLEINELIQDLKKTIESLEKAKSQIYIQNELGIVELIKAAVKRVAMREMSLEPSVIKDLIKRGVEASQHDERINIYVNSGDLKSIEELYQEMKLETSFGERIKIIGTDSVQPHGAIIETNFGEVDLQTETRFARLWDEIQEISPQRKDKISA